MWWVLAAVDDTPAPVRIRCSALRLDWDFRGGGRCDFRADFERFLVL